MRRFPRKSIHKLRVVRAELGVLVDFLGDTLLEDENRTIGYDEGFAWGKRSCITVCI